jgi:hypothetical protein
MSHELLDDSGRDARLIGQGRALATQSVEIENESPRVPVGNPCSGQVDPEHVRSLLRQWEDRGLGWHLRDELGQVSGHVGR